MKKISILCLLLLSALTLLVGCKADPEAINNTPEVFADEASDVLRTSAVLTGRIMAPAKASIKEYGFLVSSSSDFTSSDTQTIKCDENLKEFSAQITDLEIGGTYFYAAYATGGLDRMTSTVRAFTTPTRSGVLLSDLRMVDEKTATFSARVADTGGGEINAVGLCWATDNTPTTYDETVITTLNSDNTFTASLSGLEAGKTYYVRAFADSDILGDGTTQTISYSRDVVEITLEEPINEKPSISVEALSATTTSITYQITSTAVEQVRQLIILEEALEVYGEITPEFVFISDYEIEPNTTVELTASDLTPATTYYVFAAAKAGEEYLISEPAVIATQPEEVDPELTKIYYTTTDEQTITSFSNPSGLNLVSNSYENGRGVITFDGVITQIPNNFMYGKSTLKSIALPGAVTQIGYGAFESCSSLEHVTLPNGLAEIGQMAFAYTALRELILPESVAEIDNQAFMNCSDLERVTISGSPAVNTDAFSGCSSISSVHITSLEAWCKCDFGGWAYLMYSASNPCSYGATLYLNGAPVTEVTIPQGVTSLSDGAFAGCGSLLKVTIPDHVTEIGSRCFNACENLETVYCLSTTPATPKPEVFPGTYGDQYDWHPFSNGTGALTIYVPNASVESYRTAWLWKQYADCIYPMDGITSIANVSKADVIYTVEGIVTAVQQKAYILADQTGTILVYGEGHNRSIGDKIRLTTSSASYHGLIQLNTTYDTIVELLSTGNPWNYTPQIMSGPELDKLAGSSKCMEIQFSGKLYHKAMYAEMIVEDATVIPSLSYCDSSQYKDGDTTIKGYYVGTNNQYLMILSYDSELINSSTPETWKIYYTSTDGKIVEPYDATVFGANIVSNTYENGQGVILFDGPLTSIGGEAFYNCSSLTSITIPDSVTSIGNCAFYGCSDLTTFTIPDSVTEIGYSVFSGCTGLTSVTIPDSVTSIGYAAFRDCSRLAKVEITDLAAWCGINFAGDYSNPLFYAKKLYLNGSLVTDLVIPDGVPSIGGYTFWGCTGLTSVTIPDSVTSIGNGAFYNCTSLTSVTIPDSVTSIGNGAFSGCSGLTSITIPDSVTSIGNAAFRNCTGLTSATIGNGVTSIGESAFYNCTGLTSVTIPDSVTSIGGSAFRGCTGLTSVTIGNGVTSIGVRAFEDCSSLTKVEITDLAAWCKIDFDSQYSNPLYYAKNLYLNGSLVTDLEIPDGVTSIGYSAFSGCTGLTSVTIPDSVTSIGWYAFRDCTGLTSVTIPDAVASIGESAFEDCSSLTSITIPESVTSIGERAFSGCTSLNAFYGKFASDDNLCLIVDGVLNSFAIGSGATEYAIPDSVTSIGGSAFAFCTGLTSITIPDSVTEIGRSAFYACNGLTSVYCKPTTPPTGDSLMFELYVSGRKIYVPNASVDAYKAAKYWSSYASDIVGYDF